MRTLIWITVLVTATVAGCAQQAEREPPSGQQEGAPAEQAIAISATEYAFSGIPATLAPGQVTFTLTNGGEEEHEIGMIKIEGDIAVDELIRLPEKESEQYLGDDVGHGFVKPDLTDSFEAELTPGRYGYACFVEAPDGEPHALKGMYGEFTVE